jgi:hypothetical protein
VTKDGAWRACYAFQCAMKGCGTKIHCYTDTKDDGSMGNMGRHVTKCWGAEAKAGVLMEETAEKRK